MKNEGHVYRPGDLVSIKGSPTFESVMTTMGAHSWKGEGYTFIAYETQDTTFRPVYHKFETKKINITIVAVDITWVFVMFPNGKTNWMLIKDLNRVRSSDEQ